MRSTEIPFLTPFQHTLCVTRVNCGLQLAHWVDEPMRSRFILRVDPAARCSAGAHVNHDVRLINADLTPKARRAWSEIEPPWLFRQSMRNRIVCVRGEAANEQRIVNKSHADETFV